MGNLYPQPTAESIGLGNVPNVDCTNADNITSGTLDAARLPALAFQQLYTVPDQAARYALTIAQVQNGDTVQQMDTEELWLVVDDTQLNNAAGYLLYTASVNWAAITDKPQPVQDLLGVNTGNETAASIGAIIAGAADKATPVDADLLPLSDSAAAGVIKGLSWANVKAALLSYFQGLFLALPGANGIAVRTSGTTATARSIAGTTGLVDVTNGDGVAGNPTVAANLASANYNTATDYTVTNTAYTALNAAVRLAGLAAGKYLVLCTAQLSNSGDNVDAFLGLHAGTDGATTLITGGETAGRFSEQSCLSPTYTYELPVTVFGVVTLTAGQIIEPKVKSASGSVTAYNLTMTAIRIG